MLQPGIQVLTQPSASEAQREKEGEARIPAALEGVGVVLPWGIQLCRADSADRGLAMPKQIS